MCYSMCTVLLGGTAEQMQPMHFCDICSSKKRVALGSAKHAVPARLSPVYISAYRAENITTTTVPKRFVQYEADSSLLLEVTRSMFVH